MKIYYNKQGKKRIDLSDEIKLNTIIINSDTNETFDCSRIFYKDDGLGEFNSTFNLDNVKTAIGMFAESNIMSFTLPLYNLQDGTEMFCNCVDLKKLQTYEMRLTQGSKMFYNCSNIQGFQWVERDYKLENGQQMFAFSSLRKYNPYLDDFFIPKITNASRMFEGCKVLEEANIGGRMYGTTSFDASYMFKDCVNLKKFSGCLTVDGQVLTRMFEGCDNLEEFTLELKDYHRDTTKTEDCVTYPVHYSAMQRFSNLFEEDYFTSDKRESIKKMSLDIVCEAGDEVYLRQIFQNNKGIVDLKLDVTPYISQSEFDFIYNVSYISDGDEMFSGCSNLTVVDGSLDLTSAYNMFKGCNLSKDGLKKVSNLLGNGSQEIIFNKDTEDEYSYQYLNQVTLGCNEEVNDIIKEEAQTIADEKEWIVTSNVKPSGEENKFFAYMKLLGTKSKSDFANDTIAKNHKATHKIKITYRGYGILSGISSSVTLYYIFDDEADYYASPEEFGPMIKGESEMRSYSTSVDFAKNEDGSNNLAKTFNDLWYNEAMRALKLYKSKTSSISKIELTDLENNVTTKITKSK